MLEIDLKVIFLTFYNKKKCNMNDVVKIVVYVNNIS